MRRLRSSLPLLAVAGAAALLQALATLGSFAWLSRRLPVSEVGHFGLYLAIVSFVLGLDGIRQVVVVTTVASSASERSMVRALAGISLVVGALVAATIALAGGTLLHLDVQELVPLSLIGALIFAIGPGMGQLEGLKGPQYAVALQSTAWSLAIAASAALAVRQGHVANAPWVLMLAPVLAGTVLGRAALLVRPSFARQQAALQVAFDGMRTHAVTAVSGFLDKGAVAALGGAGQLGLYAPIAELTGRAGALAGLVTNLFLRDETRSVSAVRAPHPGSTTHRTAIDVFFAISCLGIVAVAALARPTLTLLFTHCGTTEVLAFRLLLAGLALNIGAQWSAVALKARGQFNLFRPYVASLALAVVLAPWLVSGHGIVGAAIVVLVMRTGDVALIFRARRYLSRWQVFAVFAAATLAGSTAMLPLLDR